MTTSSVRQTRVPIWIGILVIAGIAAFCAVAPDYVRSFGHNVPNPDLELDYLLAVGWATVLGLSIFFWPVRDNDRRLLLLVWAVKCGVMLGFMLLYESTYSLDAFGYFTSAQGPAPFHDMGIGQGTNNLRGIAYVLHALVPGSYHALKVSFGMIGMLSVFLTYRAAISFLGREDRALFLVLALFPSILFWSSIVGKDPIQLLGIAIYTYGVVRWSQTHAFRHVSLVVFGILIAMSIRLWSGPILTIPLLAFAVNGVRGFGRRAVVLLFGLTTIGIGLWSVADYFALETTADVLVRTESWSRGWEGGSGVVGPTSFTSIQELVRFAPVGMFTALFRPLPGELNNVFGALAGLENATLILLIVAAIVRGPIARLREPVVQWALLFIVTWSASYGFVSYNLGAVVRFKLQVLPLMLLTILYLASKRTRAVPARSVE